MPQKGSGVTSDLSESLSVISVILRVRDLNWPRNNWPVSKKMLAHYSPHTVCSTDMNDTSNHVACWGEIAIRFTVLTGKKQSIDVSYFDMVLSATSQQGNGNMYNPLRHWRRVIWCDDTIASIGWEFTMLLHWYKDMFGSFWKLIPWKLIKHLLTSQNYFLLKKTFTLFLQWSKDTFIQQQNTFGSPEFEFLKG